MNEIKVVAAIIIKEDKILATKRGYGKFKGGWEFPGGKIETGETPSDALKREIKEELNLNIMVGELFDIVDYDYVEFHLNMQCFFCEIINGEIKLNEHEDAKWLTKDTLDEVEWLPADISVIEKLKNVL